MAVKFPPKPKGYTRGRRGFSKEHIVFIKRALKAGKRVTDIAKHIGCSIAFVSLIKSGKLYSTVKLPK